MHHTDILEGKETHQHFGELWQGLCSVGSRVRSHGLRSAQELGQEAHTLAAYRIMGTEPKVAITAQLAARAHHMFFAATLA